MLRPLNSEEGNVVTGHGGIEDHDAGFQVILAAEAGAGASVGFDEIAAVDEFLARFEAQGQLPGRLRRSGRQHAGDQQDASHRRDNNDAGWFRRDLARAHYTLTGASRKPKPIRLSTATA